MRLFVCLLAWLLEVKKTLSKTWITDLRTSKSTRYTYQTLPAATWPTVSPHVHQWGVTMIAILTNQNLRAEKRVTWTLQVPKPLIARWGAGQWRPMRSHHGNHSDQSDYEDRKTPDLDLTSSKIPDGLIGDRCRLIDFRW